MARDLNEVRLLGRLGDAPELRYTATGQSVGNMRVATNNRYTNAAGEKVDQVQWHRVVLWGKTAELAAQYLHKGSRLLVAGRLQYREWVDAAGVKHLQAEIVADEVIYLDAAPAGGAPAANGRAVASESPF